ncbi:hypothetical protein HY488_01180, partial [Candidatus Woesearchaeota archaeon]|nr:hypothetical protein [Candidatus Woesearchaeota archaeon]
MKMESAPELQERKNIERQTAVKVWVQQITKGQYVATSGWEPNYVLFRDRKITRANIMGVVVQKSNSNVLNYDYIIIDDGSDKVMVRVFEDRQLLLDMRVGELVNIVGKPREYANEIYLVPEIIRKIDNPLWLEVRKRELERMPTPIENGVKEVLAEETPNEEEDVDDVITPGDKFLEVIRKLDHGEGVDVEELLANTHEEHAEKLLQNMLLRGDIFEIKPGRI